MIETDAHPRQDAVALAIRVVVILEAIVFVVEQAGKIHRLDDEALGRRRREDRCAQFGEPRDDMLRRR